MQAHRLPFSAGVMWLVDAVRLLVQQPLALLMLPMTYLWCMIVLSFFPYVGPIVSVLLTPGLTLGLLQGVAVIQQRGQPNPMLLLSAFKDRSLAIPFLRLGGAMLLALAVALLLSSWVDGGGWSEVATAQQPAQDAQASSEGTNLADAGAGLWVFLGLLLPIMAAFWFAPQLVGWHHMGVMQALFYSLIACWRSRWAFFGFFVAWFLGSLPLSMVMRWTVDLLGVTETSSLMFIVFPLTLILMAVFQASQLLAYQQVFAHQPSGADPNAAP